MLAWATCISMKADEEAKVYLQRAVQVEELQQTITMPRETLLASTSILCSHQPKHIPQKFSKPQNKHKQASKQKQ